MADFYHRGVLVLHHLCELHDSYTNDRKVNLGFSSHPTIMHQSKKCQVCVYIMMDGLWDR